MGREGKVCLDGKMMYIRGEGRARIYVGGDEEKCM
jgi:hypothetical protein